MSEARDTSVEARSSSAGALPLYSSGAHFRVRMVGLLILGVFSLMIVAAGSVFDLTTKTKLLIFVFGIYIALPVGLMVWAVRSYLRPKTLPPEKRT